MFRLIKLAVLGLMGYAIYEFLRGLMGGEIGRQVSQALEQGGGAGNEAHVGAGNMQFSGPGEGQRVETEDATGSGTPHFVGRGVVQR